jgi:hypothetical protein
MENFKGEGRLEPGVVKLIVMMGQTHSLAGKTKRAYRIFVWESIYDIYSYCLVHEVDWSLTLRFALQKCDMRCLEHAQNWQILVSSISDTINYTQLKKWKFAILTQTLYINYQTTVRSLSDKTCR